MSDTSVAPWQAASASLRQMVGWRRSEIGSSGKGGAPLLPHQGHQRDEAERHQQDEREGAARTHTLHLLQRQQHRHDEGR